MGIKIRFNLYRSAVFAILSCGAATAGGMLLAGELLFRSAYLAARESSLQEARSRFGVFDFFVSGADARMRDGAERALRELSRRHPDAASIGNATAAALRVEAAELGVADIFLVRPDGHIGAASFEKDYGLDLFSFGEPSASALRALFGAGRFAHQSPSQSAMSGRMSSYHYYSPPGSDILIEVATSVRDALDAFIPRGYDEFLDRALGGGCKAGAEAGAAAPPAPAAGRQGGRGRPLRRPLVRVCDLVGLVGGTVWSFAREGLERPELLHLVAVARANGLASEARGDVETLVLLLPERGGRGDVVVERRYAVLELDLSPLRRFRWIAAAAAIAACTLSGAIAFCAAKRAIDRGVTERVERLERAAERIAAGDYGAAVEDPGGDEISSIARSIADLVRLIASKNAALEASLAEKEGLLHEVHHRVKNNLQIIASLVSLQMNEAEGQEALRFLGAVRTRINSMSVVHDQLYRSASLAAVDLGACLARIAADISQDARRPGQDVSLSIDADGLFLLADTALPACLAAAELIGNCFKHAFTGRDSGRIAVSAGGGPDGGFWLAVEDDGVGAGNGLREGLGLGIANVLAAQLGGELSRRGGSAGGERFVLEVPAR